MTDMEQLVQQQRRNTGDTTASLRWRTEVRDA